MRVRPRRVRPPSPARARSLLLVGVSTPFRPYSRAPLDGFAWRYAFYARLVDGRAPLPQDALTDLAQALHPIKGHRHPVAVANDVLRTWPFEVRD